MPKINRYWNSDPDSLVEYKPPQTYDLCKCCELVNQLVWKEKRLKRALWLARADRAIMTLEYFTLKCKWFKDYMKTEPPKCDVKKIHKWANIERKCRAKAELYK